MWTNLVRISTSAQLGQKFLTQKRWPSWSQLTSVQLEQKLIIEKVPNLGTFLKARVRWEMVSNLDTIYFWPWWPEVTENEPSEIVANLATINFRTTCPEVEVLLNFIPTWDEVAPFRLVANLATSRQIRLFQKVSPSWRDFSTSSQLGTKLPPKKLIPSWDEFQRSLPPNLGGSCFRKVGPTWPNFCPRPSS